MTTIQAYSSEPTREWTVLFLFSTSLIGGAERSLTRVASYASDIRCVLGSMQGEGPWSEWARGLGLPVVTFGRNESRTAFGMDSVWRAIQWIRRNRPAIVYVIGLRAAVAVRLARFIFPGTKIVHGVRWSPSTRGALDRAFRTIETLSHWMIDAYIVNSESAYHVLRDRCRIPEGKLHLIYNGLMDIPAENAVSAHSQVRIVTLANLVPRKGHIAFLDAIERVLREDPRPVFMFVGRDEMHGQVQAEVERRGLAGNVVCPGFVSDVTPYLAGSRLFVLPSLGDEGAPTSIIEAMAYGLPVVAYAVDGIPELVVHGETGFLCELGDTEGLARRILELLADRDLSDRMGRKGRERVLERYRLSTCAEQHAQVFRRLVDQAGVPHAGV